MTEDPIERLKTTMVDDAASASWDDLLERARSMGSEWQTASAGLTPIEAPIGPQDGEWSPWHLVNHVGAWLENATNALDRAVAGESTDLGSDQAFYDDAPSLEEASRRVAEFVGRFVEQVEACSTGVESDVRVEHRLLGKLNAQEYAVFTMWHVGGGRKSGSGGSRRDRALFCRRSMARPCCWSPGRAASPSWRPIGGLELRTK